MHYFQNFINGINGIADSRAQYVVMHDSYSEIYGNDSSFQNDGNTFHQKIESIHS